MVNDPRVSSCLARLGGVYNDPVRVDRDAASLLKSPVGTNLIPIVAELYESRTRGSTGNAANVLVLQGTIAIHFKGQTYQILMDIYLPAGFPNRPPIPFVRLAPDMYLKKNHRHVGSDGKVFLPYLNQWRSNSHNLVELVVAMSSVFSADPPVYTRRPGSSADTPAPSTPSNTGFATEVLRPTTDAAAVAAGGMLSDEDAIKAVLAQQERERAEAEAQQKAEEQRRKDEERRRLEQEREEQRAVEAQEQWERQRTEQARAKVTAKLRQHLLERARQTQQVAGDLERDMAKLRVASEQKIEGPMEAMKKQKTFLEQQLAVAEEAKVDVEAWIDQARESKRRNEESQQMTIDDKVVPDRPLHAQMMELSAENAAITDALYFLDRAMHQGYLPCEVHLKQIRQLAKRQFLVRAHLIKINQVLTLSAS